MTGKRNVVAEKSFDFAVRVVNLYKYLCDEKREFVLSKQLLRSGTSIGANISEAEQAQSRKDFTAKMNIALKEAAETEYWLCLLEKTNYIGEKQYKSIMVDCEEVKKLLYAIVKTATASISTGKRRVENDGKQNQNGT